MTERYRLTWIGAAVLIFTALGCTPKGHHPGMSTATDVPPPIDLLLPKTLEIHSFTQTETFDTRQPGIRARVKARDAYGDGTKAFGRFRFVLYQYQPQKQNKRGDRLADWEIDVSQPEQNLLYWDRHTGSYEFKLGWNQSVNTGQRLILEAVFNSEFTPRLIAEREIVAGE
ncbi:MAG: hypothetical protein JXA11_12040 [Phycisphaerae bacterium]|nr:hypothetical protein [Phycisphaerae bacterium]